jgi:hypothetical protein
MTQSGTDDGSSDELHPGELWVLVDEPEAAAEGEVARFRGNKRYSAEDLGNKLQEFTKTLGMALAKIERITAGFELDEVSADVRLSAEIGFVLIAKAGIEGGITLTFRRAQTSSNAASNSTEKLNQ